MIVAPMIINVSPSVFTTPSPSLPRSLEHKHITPMPEGPQGRKRPAHVMGNAVHVMRIATGEVEEKN